MPALLALVLAVLAGLAGAPAARAADAAEDRSAGAGVPGPVVLVGVPGLRWGDVTPVDGGGTPLVEEAEQGDGPGGEPQDAARTPVLGALLRDAGVGDVAVRSVTASACPADGWLAVSSGSRVLDPRPGMEVEAADGEAAEPDPQEAVTRCTTVREPVDGALPRWPVYEAAAAEQPYDARLGLLGDALARAGTATASVGPGAAVALATSDGSLTGPHVPRPREPEALGEAVGGLVEDGAELVVVDAGSLLADVDPDGEVPEEASASTVEQLDARVGAVLAAVEDEDATVVVASLADATSTAHLGAFAAVGPAAGGVADAYGASLVGSLSTRQDGLLQTTDLAPTLLVTLGVDAPAGLVGAPVLPVDDSLDAAERRAVVLDLARAALEVRPVVGPFFYALYGSQLLLYGAAIVALRRRSGGPRGRRRVLAWLRRVSVVGASVPVSTFLAGLVPWWRAEPSALALVAAVAGWTAVVAAVALLGPWRRSVVGPLGAVAATTALVLAVDVVGGSTLQLSSLMGPNPIVAGRFYGLGNPPFALFSTGCLLLATALAAHLVGRGRRRAAVASVAVLGVACAVLDGTPGLGSDFGGPPAIVPAFAVLALLVAGVRITWRRVLLIGGGTAVVMALLATLDWLRAPADRTHLGRFVETVLDGGALDVVGRKISANLSVLTGNPQGLLVPIAALFVAFVLLRPGASGPPALTRAFDRAPALRAGFGAWLVLVLIGFAVNDSGTSIPAVAATLMVPLLTAAGARALEDDAAGAPGQREPATASSH
ncbi:hypothetical protein [Pseudokineococcus marinus]|uniref:Alkaline phosphatase family protein n=1 Tax=Pseudokineococcus marinus TaxID=351215 RepID=A0A849BQK9_9ACTN|nr:hypothetical protein [Pseudokineococcus marinus]NNH23277.1 hypothetical protein [Pseudokineococcus marinus]